MVESNDSTCEYNARLRISTAQIKDEETVKDARQISLAQKFP